MAGVDPSASQGNVQILSEVPFMSGIALARAIRERHVSSVQALQVLLERIRAMDSTELNIVIELHEEEALERAMLADQALRRGEIWGPYHGETKSC